MILSVIRAPALPVGLEVGPETGEDGPAFAAALAQEVAARPAVGAPPVAVAMTMPQPVDASDPPNGGRPTSPGRKEAGRAEGAADATDPAAPLPSAALIALVALAPPPGLSTPVAPPPAPVAPDVAVGALPTPSAAERLLRDTLDTYGVTLTVTGAAAPAANPAGTATPSGVGELSSFDTEGLGATFDAPLAAVAPPGAGAARDATRSAAAALEGLRAAGSPVAPSADALRKAALAAFTRGTSESAHPTAAPVATPVATSGDLFTPVATQVATPATTLPSTPAATPASASTPVPLASMPALAPATAPTAASGPGPAVAGAPATASATAPPRPAPAAASVPSQAGVTPSATPAPVPAIPAATLALSAPIAADMLGAQGRPAPASREPFAPAHSAAAVGTAAPSDIHAAAVLEAATAAGTPGPSRPAMADRTARAAARAARVGSATGPATSAAPADGEPAVTPSGPPAADSRPPNVAPPTPVAAAVPGLAVPPQPAVALRAGDPSAQDRAPLADAETVSAASPERPARSAPAADRTDTDDTASPLPLDLGVLPGRSAAPSAGLTSPTADTPIATDVPSSAATLAEAASLRMDAAATPTQGVTIRLDDALGAWEVDIVRNDDLLNLVVRGDAGLHQAVQAATPELRDRLAHDGYTLHHLELAPSDQNFDPTRVVAPGRATSSGLGGSMNQDSPARQEARREEAPPWAPPRRIATPTPERARRPGGLDRAV